ncbi:hypothetical protein LCGC14_2145260, partial [marine sediment metagenome]
MTDETKTIDAKELEDQAKANPKSKGWNNPNS